MAFPSFVNIDVNGDEILRQETKFQPWLKKLHMFLTHTLGQDYIYIQMTARSVKFKYKRMIDVDLLVSPYWSDQHELYRFLKTLPENKRSM